MVVGEYLYAAAAGLFEENVLRFEITVNEFVVEQEIETEKERVGKLA